MPHIHEKIDFGVEVFIVYKSKVLLRKHDKYKLWLSVGGHIELGEDPNEAAVRECKEEVGLEVKLAGEAKQLPDYTELIPPVFLNRHRISDTHEHVVHVYFGTVENDKISQGDGEVSEEIKWFTREELDDPRYGILEHVKYYAKTALDRLSSPR